MTSNVKLMITEKRKLHLLHNICFVLGAWTIICSSTHSFIHSFTPYLQLAMKMADRVLVLIDFYSVGGDRRMWTVNEYLQVLLVVERRGCYV